MSETALCPIAFPEPVEGSRFWAMENHKSESHQHFFTPNSFVVIILPLTPFG